MAVDDLVARILSQRQLVPKTRGQLVAVSGIDGSGKGYVTRQIVARLAQQSVAPASINVDGWLNLPQKRFGPKSPADNFYKQAIASMICSLNSFCRYETSAQFISLPTLLKRVLTAIAATPTVLRTSTLCSSKGYSCLSGITENCST